MKAILYLYFRTFTNRLKKAVRKPITYFYLILVLVYAVLIPITFRTTAANMNMDSPSGITAVFTVFAFWVIPANLNAFAKRKGLLYRSSDIHFLFPAPVSPKQILLYAHLRTLPTTLIMNLFMTVAGGYIFRVEWWKMLLYFLFSVIVENILEAGIMILVYGNEKLDEKEEPGLSEVLMR